MAAGPYSNPLYNQDALYYAALQQGIDPSQLQWDQANGQYTFLPPNGAGGFNPSFQSGNMITGPNQSSPTGYNEPANPNYYASGPTASSLAGFLGDPTTQANPFGMGPGSPFQSPAANFITLQDGTQVDAGTLASLFSHGESPEYVAQQLSQATGQQIDPQALARFMGAPSVQSSQTNGTWNAPAVQNPQAAVNQTWGGAPLGTGGQAGGTSPTPMGTPATTPGSPSTSPLGQPVPAPPVPTPTPATANPYSAAAGNPYSAMIAQGSDPNAPAPTTPPTGATDASGAGGGTTPGGYPGAGGFPQGTYGPGGIYNYSGAPFEAGGIAIPGGPVPAGANPAFPNWNATGPYTGTDPTQMAGAEAARATDLGNTFQNWFGSQYTQDLARQNSYQSQSDAAYSDLYNTPGYTTNEAGQITGAQGLQDAMTTPGGFQSNFLTPEEQAAMTGNPQAVQQAFDPYSVMSGVNQTGATLQNNLNTTGAAFSSAIDPSKLGISDATVAAMKEQAGRQIGLEYGAAQDQLQRQADASGNVNPLALSAARDRLLRSSAIDQADAVTQADLQAREAQRQANVGIAGMQIGTATTLGQLGQGAAEFTGQLGLGANEFAGQTAIGQAQYVDTTAAQRAAQEAQNRQNISMLNQQNQFNQGYTANTALSGRYQNIANARIQGQQAARNYWQGQGQFFGQQGQGAGASALSGAQTSLSGMGQAGATSAYYQKKPPSTIGLGNSTLVV